MNRDERAETLRLAIGLINQLAPLQADERTELTAALGGPLATATTLTAQDEGLAQRLALAIYLTRDLGLNVGDGYRLRGKNIVIDGWELFVDLVGPNQIELVVRSDRELEKRPDRPLTYLDLWADQRRLKTAGDGNVQDLLIAAFLAGVDHPIGFPWWRVKIVGNWIPARFPSVVVERAKQLIRERYGWWSPNDPLLIPAPAPEPVGPPTLTLLASADHAAET